jgi:hypothetical protein
MGPPHHMVRIIVVSNRSTAGSRTGGLLPTGPAHKIRCLTKRQLYGRQHYLRVD